MTFVPDDPLYFQAMAFSPHPSATAWESTRGGGITVAIINYGVSKGTI